jgi:hypothetical protein
MAVPVKYAIDLLTKSGWKSPEQAATDQSKAANTNANTSTSQSRTQ